MSEAYMPYEITNDCLINFIYLYFERQQMYEGKHVILDWLATLLSRTLKTALTRDF
jgi:hypothetical protein